MFCHLIPYHPNNSLFIIITNKVLKKTYPKVCMQTLKHSILTQLDLFLCPWPADFFFKSGILLKCIFSLHSK